MSGVVLRMLTPGAARSTGTSPRSWRRRHVVVAVGGGHGDDVGQVVGGRVAGGCRLSSALLPAAATNRMPAASLAVHGVVERLRVAAAAPAVVAEHDVDAVLVFIIVRYWRQSRPPTWTRCRSRRGTSAA